MRRRKYNYVNHNSNEVYPITIKYCRRTRDIIITYLREKYKNEYYTHIVITFIHFYFYRHANIKHEY